MLVWVKPYRGTFLSEFWCAVWGYILVSEKVKGWAEKIPVYQ